MARKYASTASAAGGRIARNSKSTGDSGAVTSAGKRTAKHVVKGASGGMQKESLGNVDESRRTPSPPPLQDHIGGANSPTRNKTRKHATTAKQKRRSSSESKWKKRAEAAESALQHAQKRVASLTQRAKDHAKHRELIPKPRGTYTTVGFNIQQEMKLGSKKDGTQRSQYVRIMKSVRDNIKAAGLDPLESICQQDPVRLRHVYEKSRQDEEYLRLFKNDWATTELIKQSLANMRRAELKRGNAGPTATPAARKMAEEIAEALKENTRKLVQQGANRSTSVSSENPPSSSESSRGGSNSSSRASSRVSRHMDRGDSVDMGDNGDRRYSSAGSTPAPSEDL